jgi:hypothetical protein
LQALLRAARELDSGSGAVWRCPAMLIQTTELAILQVLSCS